jgi:tRNA pseudouridine38-40 synthase
MRNILLTISYDGTDFCGWQRQDKADCGNPVRTVQGEIESALLKLHKVPVPLYGSGRTDSGVHAAAQAANFFSPVDSIPIEKYPLAINCLLPPDIRINDARDVPQDFNARFSATARTYRYFIHTGISPLASEMRFVWPVHRHPDIAVLNKMASCLKGEIDCASFAAAGDESVSSFRYLEGARFFEQDENHIVFEISANAFLWKMVRSITGSLLFFEKGGKSPDYFNEVLQSRDRKRAGPTAPSQGLFLWRVDFNGERRHL